MIEVADKFNWVDMGGIDIVKSQGIAVDGLFNRLLNSIQQCRYTLIYNWYFADVSIPPTPVELVFDGEEVKINELISVTKEDVVRVYSLEPPEPVITELIATKNSTYVPEEGVAGFNPVIVDVPVGVKLIDSVYISQKSGSSQNFERSYQLAPGPYQIVVTGLVDSINVTINGSAESLTFTSSKYYCYVYAEEKTFNEEANLSIAVSYSGLAYFSLIIIKK